MESALKGTVGEMLSNATAVSVRPTIIACTDTYLYLHKKTFDSP